MPRAYININTGNLELSGNTIISKNGQPIILGNSVTPVTFYNLSASNSSGSTEWNNTFTNVAANSANWQGTYTNVAANSANWQGSYTNVAANSANWQGTYTNVAANSANWGASFTWVSSNSANPQFTNITATGLVKLEQVQERFNTYNTNINNGPTVDLDCSNGQIFYITSSVNQNWTANLTNLNLSASYVTNVTLIIVQGLTARVPSALQIGGVSQTIIWQGGTVPAGNNLKNDAIAFSILNNAGSYIVYGQLVSFG